jgi:tetratricopeptide (TPR) repeat protein
MKIKWFIVLLAIGLSAVVMAQEDRRQNRNAMQAVKEKDYEEAIVSLQKAMKANPERAEYCNNIGHVHFRNEDYEKATENYALYGNKDGFTRSEQFHNLGNAFLQSGDYDKGIQSYIQALKLNPDAKDTKYNLSMAQALKQRMQQQQQQQQQQNQQQQNQDQQKKKDKNQQENRKDDEQQEQNQMPEPKEDEISKEDAERMLEAIEKNESEIQDDLKKKAKARQRNLEKDW